MVVLSFSHICVVASWALLLLPAVNALPLKDCDCRGAISSDNSSFCGDPRLGPAPLPKSDKLVGPLLDHYKRLGGLCPDAFLAKYTDPATKAFIFPPVSGFQNSNTGAPIEGNQTLVPGMLLDRFGFEGGSFLAPAFTPYGQRSLPPSSLNTPVNASTANYFVYKVLKEFTVLTGTIAPWFEQPGQGTQYLSPFSVSTLLTMGWLERVEARSVTSSYLPP
ncbi:hypothetical protein GGX14DRAFT_583044 [Mycena pura]|uniref:TNT domain-containing protein n=1 Tax=Mycena pura TaxID=153505 RepID=A0AAD6YVK3_9AGAR|nr:hypothetical protein GGX14DRAFT_583044 [Mycena pura]